MGNLGSTKTQKTINVHRDQNASGSAVINAPTTRGSGNVTNRIGKGGTLDQRQITNVQGIDQDRLTAILSSIGNRLDDDRAPGAIVIPSTGGTAPGASPSTVDDALQERIAGQVADGTPDSKGTLKLVLFLAAGGVFVLALVLLALPLLRRLKKKGTA